MKTLEELVNTESPGWPEVLDAQNSARNKFQILPPDQSGRKDTLLALQMSTRSILGAVVYESGGILVDGGWLRVLGSGHAMLSRSVEKWTTEATKSEFQKWPYILVADDVLGGYFALDCGALGAPGKVFYFAPDTFQWENLEIGYSQFVLGFCMEQNFDEFYAPYRWPEWRKDIKELSCDQVFLTLPPLFLKPAGKLQKGEKDIWSSRSRAAVPVGEHFLFSMDVAQQLEQVPNGATLKFNFVD